MRNNFGFKILTFFCGLAVIASTVLLAQTFAPLVSTGPGGSFIVGSPFGAQSAEQIRQNFNALVLPQYWTGASTVTLSAEKNLGALSTGLVINTAGVPSAYAGGTCATGAVSAVSASGALTCTPTLSFTQYWPAAVCDPSGAYAPVWSTQTSTLPGMSCPAGTNVDSGQLDFDDGSTEAAWNHMLLPSDWAGAIDVVIVWYSPATTGNVVWQFRTVCSAVGETIDPAMNAAQTVTDATQGVASRLNTAAITTVTTTGCAAGEMLWFRILRDPANGADTLGNTAHLIGVEMKYRRTL